MPPHSGPLPTIAEGEICAFGAPLPPPPVLPARHRRGRRRRRRCDRDNGPTKALRRCQENGADDCDNKSTTIVASACAATAIQGDSVDAGIVAELLSFTADAKKRAKADGNTMRLNDQKSNSERTGATTRESNRTSEAVPAAPELERPGGDSVAAEASDPCRRQRRKQHKRCLFGETKEAYHAMRDAVQAVVGFLEHHVVEDATPIASVTEDLRDDYENGRYLESMEGALKQLSKMRLRSSSSRRRECVCAVRGSTSPQNKQQHQLPPFGADDHSGVVADVMVELVLTGWERLARYQTLRYRKAHRDHVLLRQTPNMAPCVVEQALRHKVRCAEDCCAAQKGLAMTRTWQRRRAAMAATAVTAPDGDNSCGLAEHSTTIAGTNAASVQIARAA